jgi:hypothetical protein
MARLLDAHAEFFDDDPSPSVEEIVAKKAEVEAAFRRNGATLEMDADAAGVATSKTQAWMNDNQAKIDAFLSTAKPDDKTPDNILLSMPQGEAQEFLTSCYWYSAHGLGVYTSGYASNLAAQGKDGWSYAFTDDDLRKRRKMLNALLTLDSKGTIAQVFSPAPSQDGGLTVLAVLLILGAIALLLAAIVTLVLMSKDQKLRWAMFEKACDEARKTGNKIAADQCQSVQPPKTPPDPAQTAIFVAGAVALGYLLIVYGIPQMMKKRASA